MKVKRYILANQNNKFNEEEFFNPNGYYRKDGVFVPAHDPKTGLPLIPKEIWDEWEF